MAPSDDTRHGLTRRDFLRATAAAGAALAAAPTSLPAAETAPAPTATAAAPPVKELAVALIGCGMQGLILIDQVMRIDGIRLAAVCDIWPYSQRYATGRIEACGKTATVYADYRDMLKKEKGLDAVLIASPDFCHSEQAAACLAAGLHVYCEEPMAPTAKEARDMVSAACTAKRLLQVGYQRRSSPRYLAVQEYLAKQKAIGSILSVAAQWNRLGGIGRGWPRDQGLSADDLKKYGYDTMDRFRDWLWFKPFSAGPMSRLGGRQLDALSWLLGAPPRAILATAARHSAAKADWPDAYGVLAEWEIPDGQARRTVIGRYQILQGSTYKGFSEELTGTEGCIQVSEAQPPARLIRENDTDMPDWEKALVKGRITGVPQMLISGGIDRDEDEFYVKPPSYALPENRDYLLPVTERPYFQPHLENFFTAIRQGTPLACPGETGYQALVTALAVNQAVETGKRVELKAEDFKA
jgi:predicted dehydrogenase